MQPKKKPVTGFELIKWSFAFFLLLVSVTAFTPKYSLRKIKLSGAKSRQENLSSQGKEGMVQFVTGIHTKVRENESRPQELQNDDKFRKEMAKTCWFTTLTPGVEQQSKSGKMAEFTKSKVFFISFPEGEVTS